MARDSSRSTGKRPRRYPKEQDYPLLFEVEGATYHVVFVDSIHKGNHLGGCSNRAGGRVITLSRAQDRRELLKTALHEIAHAMEFETGLEIGHARITRLEELIVSWLEATGVL